MADLLRSGSTMLNMACPICNNPIFRNKDGNIFCPTCNRSVRIVKDNSSLVNVVDKDNEMYHEEQEKYPQSRKIKLLNSLQEAIFEKIEIITKKLRDETHSQVIEQYTKIILNCLEILNRIPFKREY
jgi:uncharacterized Zn finger protein (UPF0148 family)